MKLGLLLMAAAVWGEERVYTVCELLADARGFQRKMVLVRGVVEGGMEGSWLKTAGCPERYVVGKHSLPMAISLSYQSAFGEAPARNAAHLESVERPLRRKKKRVLTMTFRGQFETPPEWVLSGSRVGEERPMGMGHLNGFPAQLVVVDVQDPMVGGKK